MRIFIYKDQKIKQSDFQSVISEFVELYETHADITPQITTQKHDYSDTAGVARHTFDSLPYGYLKEHVEAVHKKDHYKYDHIIFLVHRDNWRPTKKIWGENFSNAFYTYHVEVCRFDHKNLANSIGTLYHEVHHSHDALIQTMLGIKIEPLLNVKSWDSDVTHGGEKVGRPHPVWDYIRYKENTASLEYIKLHLQRAYQKHKELHLTEKIKLLQRVIQLAQQVLVLKRKLLIKNHSKCHLQSQDS